MKITTNIIRLLLIASSFSLAAGIPQTVKNEIDQRIKHQLNPSIVVGVFDQGQTDFYVQGIQNKALNQAASKRTVYEIGSISKTFTSLLLAQLINESKVQLDQPVQDIWPEPFRLLDQESQAITLKQLATHSSGLPRMPTNINLFSKDPYADYGRKELLAAINDVKVKKSGVNYAYSNFAVGLLGETLAVLENSTYNNLVTTKVLQPLDLNQTHMLLSQVPKDLLAQGYHNNAAVEPWEFKALAGAGAIRSSIEDLLAYGVAHLKPSNQSLKAEMQMTTASHYQQDGLNVGLGWHITADNLIWHNGGTAGFSSIIVFDLTRNKVVAAITNSSPNNSVEDIAFHLMDSSMPMIDHQFPVAIDTDELNQFTGTFNHPVTKKDITIIKSQNKLFFTAHLLPQQALTFIGNDSFELATFKVKLEFLRDNNNHITAMNFNGLGEPQTYKKTVK